MREDCVEDRVGDLVGDLVRMAFGNGFGREEIIVCHVLRLLFWLRLSSRSQLPEARSGDALADFLRRGCSSRPPASPRKLSVNSAKPVL
ncbi:hypothetical protein DO72_5517 [Burkholderia pseudomallei]|nr:hypothetical protein DO72_5517 [Burkholderia pseudomallei]